jgi:hypothetical protein
MADLHPQRFKNNIEVLLAKNGPYSGQDFETSSYVIVFKEL